MKNLAICLLLLLGAVGCGDDYVVYETVDTMVCIPKNDFQVLEYDAASGQDRKSTRLNSSHIEESRMPSSA